MTRIRVSLPELPKGKEFEEYISAVFQCGGYYVERNITNRDIEDILELDIVVTNYCNEIPDIRLVEVKSGDCGFSDLFKVRGWMHYLKFSDGMFIAKNKGNKFKLSQEVANSLNIDLFSVDNLKESPKILNKFISDENVDSVDIAMWRFSYWLERSLIDHLYYQARSNPEKICFQTLKKYYFQLNSSIFFMENIVKRLSSLYETFLDFPLISARCANEMIGKLFVEDHRSLPRDIFQKTFFDCEYNTIQISTFIEHRARLALLKNAVDYKIYEKNGEIDKIKNETTDVLDFFGVDLVFSLMDSLPPSFRNGLDELSNHKYFSRYPVFWQWFMWIFGGFILLDYEEEEYNLLSKKTGIPVNEIPNALKAYELLFPKEDGWFIGPSSTSNIKQMKMFPVPFKGIGSMYRKHNYTENKNYAELGLTRSYTKEDMKKWHNLAIQVLHEDK